MTENNPIIVLSSRVESLEDRFQQHSLKLETKLDQLVTLMQKVTQLQEREARNADDIHDLRESNKSIIQSMDQMNLRLHERVTTAAKEMDQSKNMVLATLAVEHKEIQKELREVQDKGAETKSELNKWLNRGIGAWVVATVCIVVLQSWGAYMFNSAVDQIKEMKIELNTINVKVNALQLRELQSLQATPAKEQKN